MDTRKTLSVFILLLLFILLLPCHQTNAEKPITILIEKNKSVVEYKLDGQKISLQDLYDKLSDDISPGHDKREVKVIADEDVSISTVTNLRGILEKIGFKNIRYFYTDKEKTKKREIKFKGKAET